MSYQEQRKLLAQVHTIVPLEFYIKDSSECILLEELKDSDLVVPLKIRKMDNDAQSRFYNPKPIGGGRNIQVRFHKYQTYSLKSLLGSDPFTSNCNYVLEELGFNPISK